MEGVLYVRKRRSKLLRKWQKRYVVLTRDGVLKEYAEAAKHKLLGAIAGSGMALKQELHVRGASIVALPFPLAGRPHAFRIKKAQSFRLTLAAKSAAQMTQWMEVLRSVCGVAREDSTVSRMERARSPAMVGRIGSRSSFGSNGRSSMSMGSLELPLPRSSENEFHDVHVKTGEDLARLLQISEWNNHRLRNKVDWSANGSSVLRGSMVVAINGISLQTLGEGECRVMLRRPTRLPMVLRWLKSPHKRGVLKCKLCFGLTTQLKTIAMYRNGLRVWKEQVVEIDGDVLTCQPLKSDNGKESNRSVVPLIGGCTVKPVHEIVAEQKCCFLVSVKAYSMLFQAASPEELTLWVDAIQRAINIAEGCIPGFDLSLDDLQLESSVNMRSHGTLLSDTMLSGAATAAGAARIHADDIYDSSDEDDVDDSGSETGDDAEASPVNPVPRRGSEFPDDQLSDMLEFLQSRGRFIEALQLMSSESTQRAAYWGAIFKWAMDPIDQNSFTKLLQQDLNPSDAIQVQKDVPRTSKWLAGSRGAPSLSDDATKTRLTTLQSVLHAFLSSCDSDIRTDARSKSATDLAESKSFYMQGMNGVAFIILEVVGDDSVVALQLLRGVITHILPHVFGIRTIQSGGDNFDLFSSLIEVGNVLDEVVQMHLPNFHEAMEHVGLPVCLLAYKWFPTLFSDISLVAHRSQLRYDTLLAIWDVCLLMGIEGMFCVALALLSAAEEEVVTLRNKGASTETVTRTIVTVLAGIEPHDLTISVCEVLELCSHPVLLKLRNGHRRRLLHYAETSAPSRPLLSPPSEPETAKTAPPTPAAAATATDSRPRSASSAAAPAMTVRDLDSGKLFRISNTGSMLLPVKPSIPRGLSS